MTHFPRYCPQSGIGHTRPLSDLCRPHVVTKRVRQ
uniref:Uncharacterized protein n=1 Tax=Desulfovibrio sp. U5L TaxID=596152 RepID=I2Q048_9BACT